MLRFLFAGRLSSEKGFTEVLELCHTLSESPTYVDYFQIDIFGDGVMKPLLLAQLTDRPFVYYHGHQPKKNVLEVWQDCDYTLMPSHFLETFGLSALDSLQLGIPVLAYMKGGLAQFGRGILPLDNEGLTKTVVGLLDDHRADRLPDLREQCLLVSRQFSWDRWLYQFQEESGLAPGASVLIVNDYAVDIGGLENRLQLMIDQLRAAGYVVHWFGHTKKSFGWMRYWDLFCTLGNVTAFFGLKKIVSQAKPDLVWFHSIHRRLGWLPLLAVPHTLTQWIMFHDFGMIHPYPSRVFDEEQLVDSFFFSRFLRQGGRKFAPLLLAKRCSLRLLHSLIGQRMTRFFVPSPYMEGVFSRQLGKKVQALPLFV